MIYQYRRKETITVTAGRKKKVIIGILVALCMTVTGCAGSVKKGTKSAEATDTFLWKTISVRHIISSQCDHLQNAGCGKILVYRNVEY